MHKVDHKFVISFVSFKYFIPCLDSLLLKTILSVRQMKK